MLGGSGTAMKDKKDSILVLLVLMHRQRTKIPQLFMEDPVNELLSWTRS